MQSEGDTEETKVQVVEDKESKVQVEKEIGLSKVQVKQES